MFVLFDFTIGEPGIGTISSVKSPILTDDEKEDVITTVQEIWVRERTKLVVRWPKDFNSAICERVYEKNNFVDCDHRPGVAVAISINQENLLQLRQQLILDKSSAQKNTNELRVTNQKARRSLVYTEGDTTQGASFSVAKKSKPNPAEEQLVEEIDELKSTNRQLEDTITRLKRDLKKKEDENDELTDTLEVLRSWYEEPRELAQQMKDILLHLTDAVSNLNRRPEALPPTPAASPSQSAAKRMVPFDGDIMIEYNALRDAICYGREGQSKDSLNAMVGTLIDYFILPQEQAEYSLSGRACRSIPNSKPKKQFPVSTIDAMTTKLAPRLKSLTLHRSKSNLPPGSLHYYGSLPSEACVKLLPSSPYRTSSAVFTGSWSNNALTSRRWSGW
ncbi:hypothetical protein DAPPUDRAFT_113040 [Daphnia pulex]|uniref:BEN domain-containing protein n=1 Tax=Daphnia pulex TaxID=6669 RepID=E9HDW6_DAPPU|nr:hypothetical protein DAPPUDRAFT_113040 [Daphnia pulex]|eukprot:EFX70104.1 hypothetical protein DAPPUDRAFT_113040 [Daphnia pulex]